MSKQSKLPPRATEEPAALAAQVAAMKQHREEREMMMADEPPEESEEFLHRETRNCKGCGSKFESIAFTVNGAEACRKEYCDSCIKARDDEEERIRQQEKTEAKKAQIEKAWEKLCPPLYAEPYDVQKAIAAIKNEREAFWKKTAGKNAPRKWKESDEQECLSAIATVQAHPYGRKGLGLVGVSGHSKTRLMFTLMRRYVEEERYCIYINLSVFGREIGARFSKGASEAHEWINKLCKVPVLFLDDVGKEKMTERVETEVYSIIETRSMNLLPIYFTANSRGDALIEKMTGDDGEISDRAVPIVRRLREFCKGVSI